MLPIESHDDQQVYHRTENVVVMIYRPNCTLLRIVGWSARSLEVHNTVQHDNVDSETSLFNDHCTGQHPLAIYPFAYNNTTPLSH